MKVMLRLVVPTALGLTLWLGVKHLFEIPDKYLPGMTSLGEAVTDIGLDWAGHIAATASRTLIGFLLGILAGLSAALLLFRIRVLIWVLPLVHAIRAVPAVAVVPFFLLWFGFSEVGRYLLVILGLGLNVMVAAADVLERPSESDRLLFQNFRAPLHTRVLGYWAWRILEGLLPTLRFGVALALGVIVVSEMLGAQSGLGYLIQTSRQTLSLNVILLCSILLGLMATTLDLALQLVWRTWVNWRR